MIKAASTYEEFLALMRAKGYEMAGETFEKTAHKYITFRPMGRERAVRGSVKSLGKEYTKEAIQERIQNKQKKRTPLPNKKASNQKLIDTSHKKFQNSPGLKHWADIQNLKTAANAYADAENLTALEDKIAASTAVFFASTFWRKLQNINFPKVAEQTLGATPPNPSKINLFGKFIDEFTT